MQRKARAVAKRRPGLASRERLLDAAEKLFARYGFNGVSVRRIVQAAKVNLGAVPYHFGTKEELFKAVIFRRAQPLRAEREARLRRLTEGGKKATLEDVIRALLEPAFRASRENEWFRRLRARASMDPTPKVQKLLAEIYNEEFRMVPKTLRQVSEGLPDDEFYWRLNCFYGVMFFVLADTGKIQTIAGKDFDTSRPEVALQYVVPFLAAGFRAAV